MWLEVLLFCLVVLLVRHYLTRPKGLPPGKWSRSRLRGRVGFPSLTEIFSYPLNVKWSFHFFILFLISISLNVLLRVFSFLPVTYFHHYSLLPVITLIFFLPLLFLNVVILVLSTTSGSIFWNNLENLSTELAVRCTWETPSHRYLTTKQSCVDKRLQGGERLTQVVCTGLGVGLGCFRPCRAISNAAVVIIWRYFVPLQNFHRYDNHRNLRQFR